MYNSDQVQRRNRKTSVVIGNRLKEHFGESNYLFERSIHILTLSQENLLTDFLFLKEQLNFIVLLDICAVDNQKRFVNSGKRFEVIYHLLSMEDHQRLRVKVPLNEGEKIPSLIKIWKSACWFERETWEMFGIEFLNMKKERLLTPTQQEGFPLRKDFDLNQKMPPIPESKTLLEIPVTQHERSEWTGRDTIEFGPEHPYTRGTLQIIAEVEGEKVKRAKVEMGYLHRCFEKICEHRTYHQIIPYTDRLNYCSAPMNNIGWCKAIEDLMDIKIPERAQALRMVFAEISRVLDHLFCIASGAKECGAIASFSFCLEQREIIYSLMESYCGSRVTTSLTRVGGMAYDLPLGWVTECLNMVKSAYKCIQYIDKLLTRNPNWMSRQQGISVTANDAIEWGYTGPCLRACGVNYDIRRTRPYYFYDDVEFDIPLGVNGDSYDRYLVRMEEMRQSLRIVTQILDNLPTGPVLIEDDNIAFPPKKDIATSVEKMLSHYTLGTRGIIPPVGEIYSSTEAANGELGFYIISEGESSPYRVKVRPPCFPLLQSFPEIIKEGEVGKAMATLNSLNIVMGELER